MTTGLIDALDAVLAEFEDAQNAPGSPTTNANDDNGRAPSNPGRFDVPAIVHFSYEWVTLPTDTSGDWLKQPLALRGWRPRDLARHMEASEGTVSHQANDIRVAYPAVVRRVAMSLGVDVGYLLIVAGHRPPDPDFDPISAEAQLLPLIRSIEWSTHDRELAMIQRQLEHIAEVDRGKHDR